MIQSARGIVTKKWMEVLAAVVACGGSVGCSRIPLISERSPATFVEAGDFAADPGAVTTSPPVASVPVEESATPRPEPVFTVVTGEPELPTTPAEAVEQPVLIESKVGDVNGKPIYATKFLEPMAARLSAEAERMPRQQWIIWANNQIYRGLQDIVTDELLRAEALARLTPEQKQGLRSFLQSMRNDLASSAAGSRTLAARRLQEEQGLTEEEFIRAREQETLIKTTLVRDIDNRVNVSWRDIEQRYQRDLKVYQPNPTAVFRLIRIPTDDETAMAFVTDALGAGRPFDEVAAESKSNYKPEATGLDEILFEGPYADAAFFGGQTLNEQARTLTPGTWTGPFAMGSYSGWLKLEEIRQESISLYDAQLPIYQQLVAERRQAELQRFMDRLQARASFTSLEDMRDRIFTVADERYGNREGGRGGP